MRAKSTIQIGVMIQILVSVLAGAESAEAQARHLQHTVSVRVPSVVKIIADPVAVGPTGLPVLRVVTNDPLLRRRLEQGAEGGLVAEALTLGRRRDAGPTADFRFTVASP